jgi:hypothetical protein
MTRVISLRSPQHHPPSATGESRTFSARIGCFGMLLSGTLAILAGSGCRSVPIGDQGQLSKPNMIFADTAVFGYDSGLVAQIEPGAASNGGAQAAGCTSCK